MIDTLAARLIGTALIVSEDAVATRQLAEAMQDLALSVEVCIKTSDALDRVNHSKLEVVVIAYSVNHETGLDSPLPVTVALRPDGSQHPCPARRFSLRKKENAPTRNRGSNRFAGSRALFGQPCLRTCPANTIDFL